jgi:hypothetical protein
LHYDFKGEADRPEQRQACLRSIIEENLGRGPTILEERERIRRQTIANRRLQHQLQAA